MVYEITDTSNVSALFDKWEETLIWSCLQGIMGKIYADDLNTPTAAMAIKCLKRNLYPSRDAHNKASVALAEKLGYHYSHAYTAIEVYDY